MHYSKTTKLLSTTARRVPLDSTGWRAVGLLVAAALLILAAQAYAVYAARPQYRPIEARALSVKQAPIIIFQTAAPAPTPRPLPTPEPQIVYRDRIIEVPVIAPAVVEPVTQAPEAAPADALNDPAQNGGSVAPAGCSFPIENGACGNGETVKVDEGVKTNARGYK